MKMIPGSYKRLVHGTPITPAAVWNDMPGGSFCVSYFAPRDLDRAIASIGEDEMLILDNGAFSAWKKGIELDTEYWAGFWKWAIDAMRRCPNAVAVIPDVIGGSEIENWNKAAEAIRDFVPADLTGRLMYCWHINESLELLNKAARLFNFIAFGSCEEYDIAKGSKRGSKFYNRIVKAMSVIDAIEVFELGTRPWVHMMRGLGALDRIRFDSADSTNLAINYKRNYPDTPKPVIAMRDYLDKKVNGDLTVNSSRKEAA